ncbi:MAG: hypothetical protein R3B06_06540 [Kofleriaceae bacterium]
MSQPNERQKAVRILAKSLFKELTSQGFDDKQIVSLATELISQVTVRMDGARQAAAAELSAAG